MSCVVSGYAAFMQAFFSVSSAVIKMIAVIVVFFLSLFGGVGVCMCVCVFYYY